MQLQGEDLTRIAGGIELRAWCSMPPDGGFVRVFRDARSVADLNLGGLLIRKRLAALLQKSPLLKHVLTLLSGNLLSQVIQLGLMVFVTRIYPVDDRGLFAVYGSITTLVISVAAFRYDLAIVLPKSETLARIVHRLARRNIMVSAALCSIVCFALSQWFEQQYHSTALTRWLWFSGFTVFLVAEMTNIQFWLTRVSRFADIAMNRVIQTLTVAGLQLILALVFGPSVSMLLIAALAGQLITLVLLEFRVKELWKPIPRPSYPVRYAAKLYWRMPAFNGPNVLVDGIRNTGISLLIASHAIVALGQFDVAWVSMQMPVALLAGSISQVFLKKLSTVKPGAMVPLVRFTVTRGLAFAIIPFALIYLLSPWMFPFVFGEQYAGAGIFAQALVPWLMMTVVTSPISNVFVVTNTQHWMLVFAVAYCVAPLLWLWKSPLPLTQTIFGLGLIMAAFLAVMLVMSFFAAARFDRSKRIDETA